MERLLVLQLTTNLQTRGGVSVTTYMYTLQEATERVTSAMHLMKVGFAILAGQIEVCPSFKEHFCHFHMPISKC